MRAGHTGIPIMQVARPWQHSHRHTMSGGKPQELGDNPILTPHPPQHRTSWWRGTVSHLPKVNNGSTLHHCCRREDNIRHLGICAGGALGGPAPCLTSRCLDALSSTLKLPFPLRMNLAYVNHDHPGSEVKKEREIHGANFRVVN